MAPELDEPRKRRKYTTAERLAILKTADKVGPVEAARHHGVPQTTVSSWLHRDGTKVAQEVGAQEVGAHADESEPTRTRRAATLAISKAAVGSTAMPTPTVEPTAMPTPTVEPTMAAATMAAVTVTEVTKAAAKTARVIPAGVPFDQDGDDPAMLLAACALRPHDVTSVP